MSWKYILTGTNAYKYAMAAVNGFKYLLTANNAYKYQFEFDVNPSIVSAQTVAWPGAATVILIELDQEMNYTFEVSGETPTSDNFSIEINGSPATINTFLVNRTYESYVLQVSITGSWILNGDTVTFSYTGNTWKTKSGYYVERQTDYTIINMVT